MSALALVDLLTEAGLPEGWCQTLIADWGGNRINVCVYALTVLVNPDLASKVCQAAVSSQDIK